MAEQAKEEQDRPKRKPAKGSFEVVIERAEMIKIMGRVGTVVERRNTIPVLANVLLDATGEMLRVTGTDLDIEMVQIVECQIMDKGAVTVCERTLGDILRKMPEGAEIRLKARDGRMKVTGGRAEFDLPTLPAEDLPILIGGQADCQFALTAAALKQLIDRTRFAISSEETRYYLNGIYMHLTEGAEPALKVAATDGHRLAVVTMDPPEELESLPGAIIPRKAVGVVRKLLDGASDALIEIMLSGTKIRFHFGDSYLTAKLVDGTFPDYSRVIPHGNDKLLRIDPKALIEGVDRVSVIASDKTRAVKLALDRDRVSLTVSSPEYGNATEQVAGDYVAKPIEAGFNARYLIDALAAVEGDLCEMHFADASAPVLIREHEGASAVFVVMPMRV